MMVEQMSYIQFFDTTLRDGEQTPGVNFNQKEKIQIALQLENWGVDVIEAGFPISSSGDFESVEKIANTLKKATVCGLARCVEADIDCAYEALKGAVSPQVHIFLATSPVHLEYKLKMTQAEVLESIAHHVAYARTKFEKVQFSPEDATRTPIEFLTKAVQTAIDAGATIINIPDTVGYTNPTEFGALFRHLRDTISQFDEVIFYVSGPRVVTADTKAAMKEVLTDIQSGAFAKAFVDDNKNEFKEFKQMRASQQGHQIEEVGARLREMMPFVKPNN